MPTRIETIVILRQTGDQFVFQDTPLFFAGTPSA